MLNDLILVRIDQVKRQFFKNVIILKINVFYVI